MKLEEHSLLHRSWYQLERRHFESTREKHHTDMEKVIPLKNLFRLSAKIQKRVENWLIFGFFFCSYTYHYTYVIPEPIDDNLMNQLIIDDRSCSCCHDDSACTRLAVAFNRKLLPFDSSVTLNDVISCRQQFKILSSGHITSIKCRRSSIALWTEGTTRKKYIVGEKERERERVISITNIILILPVMRLAPIFSKLTK